MEEVIGAENAEERAKSAKRKRTVRIVALSLAGAFLLAVGIWLIIAFARKPYRAVTDYGYGSVMTAPSGGETYSATGDYGDKGLGIFARLNYTFASKTKWYSAMNSTVNTMVGDQKVETYKQFSDGILICVDITTSAFVNVAREYCYSTQANRVVWRDDNARNKANWNGLETKFPDVDPSGNMNITGDDEQSFKESFKGQNGLPATELSVYVFRENTVNYVDKIKDNADGTHTVTYHMNPETFQSESGTTEGATAYYGNQMVFTGGIDAPPTFEEIRVSFTFNSEWETLSCEIEEKYHTTMKTISTTCTATSVTKYEYDTEKAESDEYEAYFKEYIEGEATGQVERDPTVVDCLASAFGGILTEPALLDVSATVGDKPIDGKVYIDLNTSVFMTDIASAIDPEKIDLRIKAGEVSISLSDGVIYFSVGNLKLSADISEIKAMLPAASAASGETGAANDILSSLLDAPITFDKQAGTAEVRWAIELAGTEIPINFYFNLGESAITLDHAEISLGIMDLEIGGEVRFGDVSAKPEAVSDKENYASVSAVAPVFGQVFGSGSVKAELGYAIPVKGGEVALNAEVGLDFSAETPLVKGTIGVSFDKISREVAFYYGSGNVYLTIDDLHIRADVKEAAGIVYTLLPEKVKTALAEAVENASSPTISLKDTVEKLLSLDVDALVSATENDGTFSLALKTAEILKMLGIDLGVEAGDINVSLQKAGDSISVEAFGAQASLSRGESITPIDNTESYADATDVIRIIPDFVAKKGFSINGTVSLEVSGVPASIEIINGEIKLVSGAEVYILAQAVVGGTVNDFELSYGADGLKFVYGSVGVKFGDITAEAGEIKAAIDEVVAKAKDLIAYVKGGSASGDEKDKAEAAAYSLVGEEAALNLAEMLASFDWQGAINSLRLADAEGDNGIMRVYFGDLWVEISADALENALGAKVGYGADNAEVAQAEVKAFDGAMTEIADENVNYLTSKEISELISFAGTAIDALCSDDVSLTFDGDIYAENDTENKYAEFNGVKTKVHAALEIVTGGKFPITLKTSQSGRSIVVSPEAYFNFDLAMEATHADDKSLYIGVTAVDADGEGKSDGTLDFYVTASQFKSDNEKYSPLTFCVPADQVMTILSEAVALVGIDIDVLNEFVVFRWLDEVETVPQLNALGGAVKSLAAGFIGVDIQGIADTVNYYAELIPGILAELKGMLPAGGSDIAPVALSETPERGGVIKAFSREEKDGKVSYLMTLINGAEISLSKTDGADSSEIEMKVNGFGAADFGVKLSSAEITEREVKAAYRFDGVAELIRALAASATHGEDENGEIISGEQQPHHYALNKNFYIDGTITANFFGIEVPIELVAVSVNLDENGEVGINIRLQYQGLSVGALAAINGDTTVDITVKDGMVYMKRVQTSYFSPKIFTSDEKFYAPEEYKILYRALPLENLMGDIVGQIGFIFNFGDVINTSISSSGSGSGEETTPAPKEEKDFGATLEAVLKVYTYTYNVDESKDTWHLEIDGSSLGEGILGELAADIIAEGGLIRELNVTNLKINIPAGSIKLALTATASLKWHNAGGVSDGTEVKIDDALADVLSGKDGGFGGILEKYGKEGWKEGVTFLEGKQEEVGYYYAPLSGEEDRLIDEKFTAMLSTGKDGNEANTLYSEIPDLNLDDLTDDEFEYFYGEDSECRNVQVPAGSVVSGGKIYVRQEKILYNVKFESEHDFGGWNYDGEKSVYYLETEVEYGAQIVIGADTYTFNKEQYTYEIPSTPQASDGRTGEWSADPHIAQDGVIFEASFPSTVTLNSTVKFTVDGMSEPAETYSVSFNDREYALPVPQAEGYEFLGWTINGADGYSFVTTLDASSSNAFTVEALWIKVTSFELTVEKPKIGTTWTATANFNYEIVGAAKDAVSAGVQYAFVFDRKATCDSFGAFGNVNSKKESALGKTYAHVRVRVTATLGADSATYEETKDIKP